MEHVRQDRLPSGSKFRWYEVVDSKTYIFRGWELRVYGEKDFRLFREGCFKFSADSIEKIERFICGTEQSRLMQEAK